MHGQRRTYAQGCRCRPCKVSNAAYQQRLVARKRAGRPMPGAKVDAKETWKLIHRLMAERFTKAMIARALGLRGKSLKLHPDRVTVRNALKVRRLFRQRMGEPPA